MSADGTLMAKPLSRKIIPLPTRKNWIQHGGHNKTSHPRRDEKSASIATQESHSCLTPQESNLAQALSNITTNYQRPDPALLEAMKRKKYLKPTFATSITSSSPATKQDLTTTPALPPPHRPLSSQPSTTPAKPKQTKRKVDWEAKAQQIIERDDLSLDRDWSRISWKQKANNIVRLKLLKDDGYDITALLQKGVTADQIIDVVFERVEDRKKRGVCGVSETSRQCLSNICSEGDGDEEGDMESFNDDEGKMEEVEWNSPEKRVFKTTSLIPAKRKYGCEGEDDKNEEDCACGFPPRKMARVFTQEEVDREIEKQAHELVKWRICREIFQSSRLERNILEFQSTATDEEKVVLKAPRLVVTPSTAAKVARIIFTSTPTAEREDRDVEMNMGSTGFNMILQELKCLAWSFDEQNGSYSIRDYDYDVDDDEDMHGIRLSCTHRPNTAALEGEITALVSLLRYLRHNELYHLGRYRIGHVLLDSEGKRDVQMRVVRNERLPCHLSHAVEGVLEGIERILEKREREEVRVHVVRQEVRFRVT